MIVDRPDVIRRKANGVWIQNSGVYAHLVHEANASSRVPSGRVDICERLDDMLTEHLFAPSSDGVAPYHRPERAVEKPRSLAVHGPLYGNLVAIGRRHTRRPKVGWLR